MLYPQRSPRSCTSNKMKMNSDGNVSQNTWYNSFWKIASGRSLILLICTIICLSQTIQLLYRFFAGEKWSTNQILRENTILPFPNVTLCNFNRINLSKAKKLGLSEEILNGYLVDSGLVRNWTTYDWYKDAISLQEYMFMMVFYSGSGMIPLTTNPHHTLRKDPTLEYPRKFYNYYKERNPGINITNLAYNLAHDCSISIEFCQFSSVEFANCCAKHTPVYTDYGVCFDHQPATYDGLAPAQIIPGVRGGYTFIYNVQHDDHIEMSLDNNVEDGVLMLIHFDGYYTSPVVLKSKNHAYVEISYLYRGIEHAVRYSHESCIFDCWYAAVVDRCKCTPQVVRPEHVTFPYCEPDDVQECIFGVIYPEWTKHDTTKPYLSKYLKCMKSCRTECVSRFVKTSVTYADYPSTHLIENKIKLTKLDYNTSETYEHVLENFIVVDIFYSSLTETAILKYPQATVEQLLGNVGGQIGLWLGASIITLYEAIHGMFGIYKKKKVSVADQTILMNL